MSRYAGIIYDDIANGTGFGAVFFIQGCPHHCPGCQNPQTWYFNGGKEFTIDTITELMDYFEENPFATRLSISGGEPLANTDENYILTDVIANIFKNRYPLNQIWLWTGYRFEDLNQYQKHSLRNVDVLIDGPFIEAEKDLTLAFRGSKNQRILDCQESIRQNKAVLYKE